jgi:hypothetical protein
MEEERIQRGLRMIETHRKASAAYYERKRQEKIDAGTYRGRGRPKKVVAEDVQKGV